MWRRSGAPAPGCCACLCTRGARSTVDLDAAGDRRRARSARRSPAPARAPRRRTRARELARARSGMMLTACRPCVTYPCTRTPSRKWTRCESTRWNVLSHRGERARAVPRGDRRVRGLAVEVEVEVHVRERRVRQQIAIEGVEHHRGVDALEHARFEQLDLAAAALLRGGADQVSTRVAGDLRAHAGEREERADGARGDEVVPARVPDLGQRVVLREDGDPRARPCRCGRGRPSAGRRTPRSTGRPPSSERPR
jgi:hypothetical protein